MATDYIEVTVHLSRPGDFIQDLLIAGLGEAGYESFLETETGFNAYISQNDFSERSLRKAIDETNRIFADEASAGNEASAAMELLRGESGVTVPGESDLKSTRLKSSH